MGVGVCGCGGGIVQEYGHEGRHIFHNQHIVTTYSTEPYSFVKIILMDYCDQEKWKCDQVLASRQHHLTIPIISMYL